ncbi:hypothetical protein, partial [Paraburkholderia humisilvae]|uniref:hypothetical protein n=1 Tax=Paraburkholderia humisilvae TaxID=627669 RepID=UPI0035E714F1
MLKRAERVLGILAVCIQPVDHHPAARRLRQTREIRQPHQGWITGQVIHTPAHRIDQRIAVKIDTAGMLVGPKIARQEQALLQAVLTQRRSEVLMSLDAGPARAVHAMTVRMKRRGFVEQFRSEQPGKKRGRDVHIGIKHREDMLTPRDVHS